MEWGNKDFHRHLRERTPMFERTIASWKEQKRYVDYAISALEPAQVRSFTFSSPFPCSLLFSPSCLSDPCLFLLPTSSPPLCFSLLLVCRFPLHPRCVTSLSKMGQQRQRGERVSHTHTHTHTHRERERESTESFWSPCTLWLSCDVVCFARET